MKSQDIIGTWVGIGGQYPGSPKDRQSTFEFEANGQFSFSGLPREYFRPTGRVGMPPLGPLVAGDGTWSIAEYHGRTAVAMSFEHLDTAKLLFKDQFLYDKGSTGDELFVWIGDPDLGSRYRLKKH
jgi:hypothetical protein